ncbi:hypothetical protein BJ912DRAFT_1047355 [Pholiota molesta]|nr:hypothetical protein BJ912DRAFT_1047355 [Pholiota molesta]
MGASISKVRLWFTCLELSLGHHMLISGGQFIWAQTYNNYMIQKNDQIINRKSFQYLCERVATSALHDSAQRVDPPRCHPNTREVVLRQIFDWMVSSNDREAWLMWLNGAVGAGKSAIAQSTAERCVQAKRIVISFFFSGTDPARNTMAALAATLAYQLILAIPETAENVLQAIERNPLIFGQSVESQIKQLFFDPLVSAQHLFPEHMLLALHSSLIMLLGKYLSTGNLPVQFLIASRPEPHIDSLFKLKEVADILVTLSLDKIMHVSNDIRRFLEDKFAELKNNHRIKAHLPSDWPASSSIEEIIAQSSGQFIYASLAMNYIASPRGHPVHQLQTLEGIRLRNPSSKHPLDYLDALYRNIFSRIDELDKVLDILAFVLLAGEDRVSIIDWVFQFEPGELETALVDLAAVLTIDSQSEVAPTRMRLLHASLSDFLLDGTRSEEYHISFDSHSTKLACLAFARPPTQIFSVSDTHESVIPAIIRLLEKAAPSTELHRILLRFAPEFEAMHLTFKHSLLPLFNILVAVKNLQYLNRRAVVTPGMTRQIIVQTMEEQIRFYSDNNLEDLRYRLQGIILEYPYRKKKALFVGINYYGQRWELKECINDIKSMEDLIISVYGCKQEDIVTLTDDATHPHARPTRSNILIAMEELDTGGDEVDSKDEDCDPVIYPVDYESEGYIANNLIYETMVKPLPEGCRLTAVIDSGITRG